MAAALEEMKRHIDELKTSLETKRRLTKELQVEASAARAEVEQLSRQRQDTQATADSTAEQPATGTYQPLYLATSRKLERFRDRPEKAADPTVEEWVADIKGHLSSRQLQAADQAPFIVDHLVGKARQEIIGRGKEVSGDPTRIFYVLKKVFGAW